MTKLFRKNGPSEVLHPAVFRSSRILLPDLSPPTDVNTHEGQHRKGKEADEQDLLHVPGFVRCDPEVEEDRDQSDEETHDTHTENRDRAEHGQYSRKVLVVSFTLPPRTGRTSWMQGATVTPRPSRVRSCRPYWRQCDIPRSCPLERRWNSAGRPLARRV